MDAEFYDGSDDDEFGLVSQLEGRENMCFSMASWGGPSGFEDDDHQQQAPSGGTGSGTTSEEKSDDDNEVKRPDIEDDAEDDHDEWEAWLDARKPVLSRA